MFAVGTDEAHRSESLAITQVLILYHLVTAKATAAIGGDDVANRARLGELPASRRAALRANAA